VIERTSSSAKRTPACSRRCTRRGRAASSHRPRRQLRAARPQVRQARLPCQTIARESSDPRTTALLRRIARAAATRCSSAASRTSTGASPRCCARASSSASSSTRTSRPAASSSTSSAGRRSPPAPRRPGAGDRRGGGRRVRLPGEDGGHRFEVRRLVVPGSAIARPTWSRVTQAMSRSVEEAIRRARTPGCGCTRGGRPASRPPPRARPPAPPASLEGERPPAPRRCRHGLTRARRGGWAADAEGSARGWPAGALRASWSVGGLLGDPSREAPNSNAYARTSALPAMSACYPWHGF
jgi:hypothetical protein